MAAYENDSEAYWWAFGIFDPFPNPPYYRSGADQETTFYTNYCVREVTEVGQEGTDETGPSSLCSSPGGYSCRGEFSLKISDEYSVVDGEVGGRLNQMHPIPHVPRINGDIPSFDEATSDHQRLLERLRLYDLVERKVQGDGNCQFRSLSDQLYQTSEHHEFVRQQVVEQLKSHPEIYDGYVPMAYSDYLKKISQYAFIELIYLYLRLLRRNTIFSLYYHLNELVISLAIRSGEWGDHVTLQAAADSYGVKIFVITSFKDTCYIEILPSIAKSKRVIFLSFWAEVHYNSIYLEEKDPPTADTKRKKRWWQLGNKH